MVINKKVRDKDDFTELLEEFRDKGYITSREISSMLNDSLKFGGNRDRLFDNMRNLAKSSNQFECIEIREDEKPVTCLYPFWQIARMLEKIEMRDRGIEEREP